MKLKGKIPVRFLKLRMRGGSEPAHKDPISTFGHSDSSKLQSILHCGATAQKGPFLPSRSASLHSTVATARVGALSDCIHAPRANYDPITSGRAKARFSSFFLFRVPRSLHALRPARTRNPTYKASQTTQSQHPVPSDDGNRF